MDHTVPDARALDLDSIVPVTEVTTGLPGCTHRFYDTSPVSPSGRYVAVTRLADERRLPVPGEGADVVLVDLESGSTRTVAQTTCWDTQLGAQVQWGASDRELLFNRLDDGAWRARAVVCDPETGAERMLDGALYHASTDGTRIASPSLHRIGFTQLGYGFALPQQVMEPNVGAPDDDGIFVSEVAGGQTRLILSLAEIYETLASQLGFPDLGSPGRPVGALYGFHVKWSPAGDRLMFVVRYRGLRSGAGWKGALVTCNADGSRPRVAVPASLWGLGGHHPNWCPDGEHIIMNLSVRALSARPGLAAGVGADDRQLRFARISHDGTTIEAFDPDIVGGGHPTLHPDGHHILTDAYPRESVARDGGVCPLRWIDTRSGKERSLLWMPLTTPASGPYDALRVDMHPAWDREYQRVVINGTRNGHRYVHLVEMGEML